MPYQQDCTVLNLQALNDHAYELLLEADASSTSHQHL